MKWVTRSRPAWAAALVAVVMGLTASSAFATTTYQDISSAGPLTNLYLGNDLDCQVLYSGSTSDEFYPPDTSAATPASPGDCGTFVSIGAHIYGPNFSTNEGTATTLGLSGQSNYTTYTAGAQSAIAGNGQLASPYSVTSTSTAGSTGVSVSQTDSYIVGDEAYTTAITLTNNSGATVSGLLYHAGDCYLQGSDFGYGEFNATDQAPACTQSPNNSPAGLIEEMAPLTAGSRYLETEYDSMWSAIDTQHDLPDTCDCTTDEDNGVALNWDFTLPAHQSATYEVETNFSATGILAGSPTPITAPTITGTTISGQVLTEGHGTWRNSPTSYAYQWEDCDTTGANCVAITGASAQTYTLQASDVGHTVRVVEAGINNIGQGHTATSLQTGVVTAPQPVTIATVQSAKHHKAKAALSLAAGVTGEADHATLTGANVAIATGTVTYDLYRNKSCTAKSRVLTGRPEAVTAGKAPASKPVTKVLKQGRYYWQVTYSGDAANLASASTCGSEVLHVTSPVSVRGPVIRTHHSLAVRMACGVVPCSLAVTVTSGTGHHRVTVATGTALIKKTGFHGVGLHVTHAGLALIRSTKGKLALHFGVTARIHHVKLTSGSSLKAALG